MKFSLVIPQLFYDAIARIIPGAVLILLIDGYEQCTNISLFFTRVGGLSAVESFGARIVYGLIAYIFGLLLSGLVWPSKKPVKLTWEHSSAIAPTKESSGKSIRDCYQWIRLAYQEPGFVSSN
ncbi:MAG: hypothetical protein HGB15_00640 [Chlorobaculum sp.]|nr:hypothetical protein [Chlorobaculum sp.]